MSSPAFKQTALLRCWLSRHKNRKRLFEIGVPYLTVGFAFYDQAQSEIVYSTGGNGLIYLPFYRPIAGSRGTISYEFDPLDRIKHDVLAVLRSHKHEGPPRYAKIFNSKTPQFQDESDLRSPFENAIGVILAPDGEISCFALNYFLRRMLLQLNNGIAIRDICALSNFLESKFKEKVVIYPLPQELADKQRVPAEASVVIDREIEIGRRLLALLNGWDPLAAIPDQTEHPDYAYIPKLIEAQSEDSRMPVGLSKAGLQWSLMEFMQYLGLFNDKLEPTDRFNRLENWFTGYRDESFDSFRVPRIEKLLNSGSTKASTPRLRGYAASGAKKGICMWLAEVAASANFSCLTLPSAAADLWSQATRTTFLGHTLARCNSTAPSCWLAFPIQAERGSQSLSRRANSPNMAEIGFLLSLIDSSGKNVVLDPFAARTPPNREEIIDRLLPLRQMGFFLGKTEADKVYWLEIIRHNLRLEARENAIAAISSQSLSHNIGSHALSDARLFDPDAIADGLGLKDFHQYLQGRLDYVAQLIARTPPQPEPMYLWQDVLCEFFRQRLLLNRLVADRSVEGRNLSFKVSFPDGKETTIKWEDIENWLGVHGKENVSRLEPPGPDVLVAIPGGSVGRHALYSTLENLMRNSVKYGGRRGAQNDLCINFRLRNPDRARDERAYDYWLLEIWDNFSGFPSNDSRYGKLAKDFMEDVIDDEGKARPAGHGLIEIKAAMRFLHARDYHEDETRDSSPYACVPDCHRTSPARPEHQQHCCHANLANIFDEEFGWKKSEKQGVLVYRIRLRRPRMLGVLAPGCEFEEKDAQNVTNGVFFRKGLSLTAPGLDGTESLADLAPHLLVIRDDGTADADSLRDGIVEEIAEQHWRLPFRLFVVVENEDRREEWAKAIKHWEALIPTEPKPTSNDETPPAFLPRNRVRILIAPELHKDLAKPQGNPESAYPDSGIPNQESQPSHLTLAFVNRVYDHWLMAYKPLPDGKPFTDDAKWHLAVVFERDEEDVKRIWDGATVLEEQPLRSLSATAYFKKPKKTGTDRYGRPKTQEESVVPVAGKMDWEVTKDSVARLIHFGNHGASPPGDSTMVDAAKANNEIGYSQAFGSSEGPRTFNMLYSPPTDPDGFAFFCLTVVEAALTRVAAFDERVFGVFFAEKESKNGKLISHERVLDGSLAWMFPLLAAGSENAPSEYAVSNIDWEGLKDANTEKPPFPANACMSPIKKGEDDNYSLQIAPIEAADVLVLHEGLIEELVGNSGFQKGSELCLFNVAPHIVRTSGKGRDARQLGAFLPFCEYSAISAALAPLVKTKDEEPDPIETLRLEKISLARSILNTIGATPENRSQS